MEYRVKFDGHYVKEVDYKYLVECPERESVFSETNATIIVDKCPNRAEKLKIITKEYEAKKYVKV